MIDTAGSTAGRVASRAADAQVITADAAADDGYVPLTVAEWLDTPDGQDWARTRHVAGLPRSTGSHDSPPRPFSYNLGVFAEIKVDSGLSWGSAWTCRLSADQELVLLSNELGLGLLPDLAHLPSPG